MKATRFIYGAPIIFVNDGYYVIGGRIDNRDSDVIGRLSATTKVWSLVGKLVTQRRQHNVIFDGNNLLVIGGEGEFKTEKCTTSSEQVSCIEQNPSLRYYSTYPELFLAPFDFCKA